MKFLFLYIFKITYVIMSPNTVTSNNMSYNNKPITRGEIILRHNTCLPTEIIKYILEFWFGDDVSQLILDWKNRMSPISQKLSGSILEHIKLQYDLLGTNMNIHFTEHDLFWAQEMLYYNKKYDDYDLNYELRSDSSRILVVQTNKRELVIYNKLYNDTNLDTRGTLIKYRMKYKHGRFDTISNPNSNINDKISIHETGLFTLPVRVKRKDNRRKILVYSKSDFKQSAAPWTWSSRYGQQQCNTLSEEFKKLWKKGIVDLPNNNRIRHILKTNKSGKTYIQTINSHGLVVSINKNKNIKPIVTNKPLRNKTGQELRDILSILTNQPTGLKSSGKLKTKNDIINKIIELQQ